MWWEDTNVAVWKGLLNREHRAVVQLLHRKNEESKRSRLWGDRAEIDWDSFNWKFNAASFIIYFLWNSGIKKKRLQWNMGLPACSRISQKPLFSFPWSQEKHVFSGSIFSSLKQKLSLLCVPTVPSAIGLLSQQGLLSAIVIKLINHNF